MRPKHDSKRKRRGEGRASSSDEASNRESVPEEDEEDDAEGDEDGDIPRLPSTAPSDTPSQPVQALTPREKFDRRYKTATNSNEEVRGVLASQHANQLLMLVVFPYPDLQVKAWNSDVYQHFVMPPDITLEKGEVRYVFACKKCVSYSFELFNFEYIFDILLLP